MSGNGQNKLHRSFLYFKRAPISLNDLGSCSWSLGAAECAVNDTTLFTKLAEHGEKTKDPLCTYFSSMAENGCLDIAEPGACFANVNCDWQIDKGLFAL